MSALYVIKT